MGAIVTQAEVEKYLSTPVVRATYDDNNDGGIDGPSLAIIIASSEALFLAHLRGLVPLPLTAPIDPFAKDIVFQIVHCKSIKRFPEIFRQGNSVCEEVEKLLEKIRKGELKIDTAAPPAAEATGLGCESFTSRYIHERDFGPEGRSSSFENASDDD